MAFDAVTFYALPEPGGLRDQPVKLMRTMRACLNVYNALTFYNRSGKKAGAMAKWKKENPEAWETVSEIRALRQAHGLPA